MKFNYKTNIYILTAALIWGVAFVFQEMASKHLGNFAINGFRGIIAFLILFLIVVINSKKQNKKILGENKEEVKTLLKAGFLCGIFLCTAVNLQQLGLSLYPDDIASAGRTSFLTGLYGVFVAIISLMLNKKLRINVIISVVFVMIGLYLLCFDQGIDKIYISDLINLICSLFFALQIIVVDKYIDRVDGIKLSAIQLLISGSLSFILMFIFEDPTIQNISNSVIPLLYLGILSSGVAHTFQIIGQKHSNNPTVDSIIMSLEVVFATIAGVVILKETLELKEIIACVIMFASIVLSQLPAKKKKSINVE